MINLIILFFICVTYLSLIKIKLKVNCISEAYYKLNETYPYLGSLHQLWILLTFLLICPLMVSMSESSNKIFAISSSILFLIQGFFPDYRNSDRGIHQVLSYLSGLSILIWMSCFNLEWLLIGSTITSGLIYYIFNLKLMKNTRFRNYFRDTNLLYWLEIPIFISVFICLILILNNY